MALEPYWADDMVTVHVGDCRKVLPRVLADDSIDAVVCDPPYELGFMGRDWDASGVAFDPATWRECLRVLKPGGHLVAFGGTRTWHRLAVAIEDVGFDLRDTLMWIYGSGFPKSLDVSKAIDKAAGAERVVIGANPMTRKQTPKNGTAALGDFAGVGDLTAPATEDAARWSGWGSALKPGWEPIILARKPLAGTVVQTVLEYGTGALSIAACRVATDDNTGRPAGRTALGIMNDDGWQPKEQASESHPSGRWPTNLIFTHSARCEQNGACDQETCPVAELDRQSGVTTARASGARSVRKMASGSDQRGNTSAAYGAESRSAGAVVGLDRGDGGGASRFYPTFRYTAKASTAERPKLDDGTAHATVKPVALMRWLVRLITPPGGVVLDPFAGSGTTGEACVLEGFQSVLIELEQPHAELIKQRLSKPLQPSLDLFSEVSDGS